ncbi:MAG: Fe-S-cluster containining protein [Marinoscillum sp.]|jgi:Fe-S-cluster containining protein
MEYQDAIDKAQVSLKANIAFFKELKKKKPKSLDDQFHTLHHETFQQIDCLACANCCKTTSPIFQRGDIERLAKTLKMKVPAFIETYLQLDKDDDYVLTTAPCPFLGDDNKCIVYDSRPTACREYPHTNRKRMYQILDLTLHNTLICPAVSMITQRLVESFPSK